MSAAAVAGTRRAAPWRIAHPTMGTVASLTFLPAGHAAAEVRDLLARACRVLDDIERVFTTWDAGSPMSAHRRGRPVAGADGERIAAVLARCEQLRRLSGGWFDPWAMPGGVDPSGYVKGWAAGEALAVLAAAAPLGASIGVGGDVATFGAGPGGGPWRIAVSHPWRRDAFAGIVAVSGAIATSGNYARQGQLYDPATGALAERIPSATVTGPDPGDCDALATALAVGGRDAAAHLDGCGGLGYHLIEADGTEVTAGDLSFVAARLDLRTGGGAAT